jgi:hypothetical protein
VRVFGSEGSKNKWVVLRVHDKRELEYSSAGGGGANSAEKKPVIGCLYNLILYFCEMG